MIDFQILSRTMPQTLEAALMKAANHWFANMKPLHFREGAAERYNYRARTAKWRAIKARAQNIFNRRTGSKMPALKPPRDLVWTGDMEREVASQTTPAGARVMASGGFARIEVPIRLGHPVRNWVAKEVTTISGAEAIELMEVMQAEIARQIQLAMRV